MIINYKISGTIQVEDDDPDAAVGYLTPKTLVRAGELHWIDYELDGKVWLVQQKPKEPLPF